MHKLLPYFIFAFFASCMRDNTDANKLTIIANDGSSQLSVRRDAFLKLIENHLKMQLSVENTFALLGKVQNVESRNCEIIDAFAGAWPFYERKSGRAVMQKDGALICIKITWDANRRDFLWLLFSHSFHEIDFAMLLKGGG